jgi:hypothetical protein
MKKALFSFAIAMAATALVACGGKSANNAEGEATTTEESAAATSDESPAMQLLNSVPFTPEGLQSMIKTEKDKPLTDLEYEALWLGYSKIDIDEKTLELKNTPEFKAIKEQFRDHKRPSNQDAIIEKLINSTSPQVKGMALLSYTSLFGVSSDNVTKVANVLKDEKNPFVLKKGIRTLMNELKKEEAAKFVLAQVKNENSQVRKEAAIAIGNPWSQGVPGVTEAAKELLYDKDDDVRGMMLHCVGKLYDDSFIPDLVKVLNDDSQPKMHGEAIRSLYTMWYDYPFHKHTSKAAYDATVNYLKKKPRTNNIPYWTSITETKTRAEKDYPAWKAKATYFKENEWVKLMTDIATDPNANWLGRGPAVEIIAKYGTKADVEKVKSIIQANNNDKYQSQMLSSIEKVLK